MTLAPTDPGGEQILQGVKLSTANAIPEFAVVATEGWFDGERHYTESTTFRIREGRVGSVASGDYGAALAAQRIPVSRGSFLMPGLVDAHVHLL